jgi:hypothetical protein
MVHSRSSGVRLATRLSMVENETLGVVAGLISAEVERTIRDKAASQ